MAAAGKNVMMGASSRERPPGRAAGTWLGGPDARGSFTVRVQASDNAKASMVDCALVAVKTITLAEIAPAAAFLAAQGIDCAAAQWL